MKTIISTLVIATTFAGLMALLVIYTGMFNVATEWEDPAPIRWALVTTRENSIKSRATSIEVPPTKGDKQIDTGFRGYREMCAVCHTPPGGTDSPITKGLNPVPPDLAKSAEHMSAAELFWVVKYGIRMTGMPAWGATHKDGELWDIVAFVKKLPEMSKSEYLEMDGRLEKGHSHAGGGHGDGGHDDGGHDDGGHDDGEHNDGDDHHGDSKSQKTDDHEHADDGHAHTH